MDNRSKEYARIRRWLWLADEAVSLGLLAGLLISGVAQQVGQWTLTQTPAWPLQVALYAGFLGLVSSVVLFPLESFGGFFLERRFGLTTQTFGGWLVDHGKQLAVGGILGLAMIELLSFFLRARPENWWIWAGFGWMAGSVLLTRVAPVWIIPLFYKQKPMQDLQLKEQLDQLLERCAIPVRGIFEINLSRTTRKANACLCGMGRSRRVLLSDTLLDRYPPEEVQVVLAHEVGHHRGHHIRTLILASGIGIFFSSFLIHRTAGAVMAPLGLAGWSDLAVLPLIGLGFGLTGLVLMPVLNGLSRRLEAQADRFALEKTGNASAFIGAMRRLAEQNLAEIDPPRWVEWLFYDHPAIARRIAMAERVPNQ